MPYKASHRFARISARKVRPVADLIRGKFADEALEILRYQPQRGARLLEKVLRSAMANAEDQQAAAGELIIIDVRVDGGPMFKRLQPRARGMAFMIKKRMSHLQITLETRRALEAELAAMEEELRQTAGADDEGEEAPESTQS